MQRFYRLFAAALTAAVLFPGCSTPTTAEEFASGGSAAQPAIAAYESWMQFASPDTHTPAIDTAVSYTHLRAHETRSNLVCRLLLEKKIF